MQARGHCSSRGDGKMNDAKRTANRDTVTLTDNSTGKSLELPVLSGSVGPRAIDVSRLYGETGSFPYDPGFTSTAACAADGGERKGTTPNGPLIGKPAVKPTTAPARAGNCPVSAAASGRGPST